MDSRHKSCIPSDQSLQGFRRGPYKTHKRIGELMLDMIFILATVGFFVVAWLYVGACDRV